MVGSSSEFSKFFFSIFKLKLKVHEPQKIIALEIARPEQPKGPVVQ